MSLKKKRFLPPSTERGQVEWVTGLFFLLFLGILLCALLLCVVMKDSLQTFIETIVSAMTSEARDILTGGRP